VAPNRDVMEPAKNPNPSDSDLSQSQLVPLNQLKNAKFCLKFKGVY